MEDRHLETGARGEELAAAYLEAKGWTVSARNVRVGRGELDIVACDGEELVIVEVRTRTVGAIQPPELSVGPMKLRKLMRAAKRYVEMIRYDGCWRIDIAAVTIDRDGHHEIELYQDITMGMEGDRL